ncbi:MAG: hypothetical protein QXP38_08660 [Nitrososphaerota archaeon]
MKSPGVKGTDGRNRDAIQTLKGVFFYIALSLSSLEISLLMVYLYLRFKAVSTITLAKYIIIAVMIVFLALLVMSFINSGRLIEYHHGDEKRTVKTTFSWVVGASVIAALFYFFALFVFFFPYEFRTGVFTTAFLAVLAVLSIFATIAILKAMKFMSNFSVLVNEPAYMRVGKFLPIILGSFISVVALVVYYSYNFASHGVLTFNAFADALMFTFLFHLILGMMIPIVTAGLMSVYGYAISLKYENDD